MRFTGAPGTRRQRRAGCCTSHLCPQAAREWDDGQGFSRMSEGRMKIWSQPCRLTLLKVSRKHMFFAFSCPSKVHSKLHDLALAVFLRHGGICVSSVSKRLHAHSSRRGPPPVGFTYHLAAWANKLYYCTFREIQCSLHSNFGNASLDSALHALFNMDVSPYAILRLSFDTRRAP